MEVAWPDPDFTSPYFCHGPTLLSFSGGETSAYMLYQVLCAHGGVLPDYVIVAFANTGREMEETLRFVHECATRWGVRIYWVEWRPPTKRLPAAKCPHKKRGRCADCKREAIMLAASKRFELVGFNSADREGRWFAELIRRKQYLPNQDRRYCTEKLKIDTMKWLMVSLGYERWFNMVGLRADERHRVIKQVLRNASGVERFVSGCPMAVAGATKRVVERFWHGARGRWSMVTLLRQRGLAAIQPLMPQGFILGLYPFEGNCDLCFLKGRFKKMAVIRSRPATPKWWSEQEHVATKLTKVRTSYMKRFDKDESVDDLVKATEASPMMRIEDDDENDAECGVTCIANDTDEPVDDETWAWVVEQLNKAIANPIALPKVRKATPAAVGDLFAEKAA
jgi:3'-phosphoadenosine 5'-phosphosulfate sulfotransferase (PAPS reductase)/FAD synthetase